MASKRQTIADKDRFSIIVPSLNTCMICGSKSNINIHEVFFGVANRPKSIEDGMCVPLCRSCHQGPNGVHNNKTLDLIIKKRAEKVWLKQYTDPSQPIDDRVGKFIQRFGRNYLDEEDLKKSGF